MAMNQVNPGSNFEVIVAGTPRFYRGQVPEIEKSHGRGVGAGYSQQCSDTGPMDVGTAVVPEWKKKLGARDVAPGRHRVPPRSIFLRICRRGLRRVSVGLWVSDRRRLRLGRLRFIRLHGHMRKAARGPLDPLPHRLINGFGVSESLSNIRRKV